MENYAKQSNNTYCKMYKRGIVSIIILLGSFTLFAQIDSEMAQLDSITYAQYYHAQWKQLLQTADNAIQSKKDFYWLNVRAAIAASAIHKPYRETSYLQNITKEYPFDPISLPLVYLNQLNTGQYAHALQTNHRMQSNTELQKYYTRRPVVHSLSAESGYKPSSNDSLYKPLYYGQAGLAFRIKHIPIYTAVSYLKQQSYYGNMQQYQLYVNATLPFKRNWTVTPALHILHYNIENTITVNDSSVLQNSPILVGLNIAKLFHNFQYNFGVYYSNLNYEKQLQIQPSVNWYPLANNKIILNAAANYIVQKNKVITSATITYNPITLLSFSGSYLAANTRYFIEQNGLLVNNSYDPTGNRYLGMVTFFPRINWSIYVVYLYETKTLNQDPLPVITYNNQMGVLGIKRAF